MSKSALVAFSGEERDRAHALLALRVAKMMGRKMEEGDWSAVYCGAKGIPEAGWSNLNIDVVHGNLGVEHKMLCYSSKPDLDRACGTTLMHPSLTRSIRIDTIDADPNDVMRDVFDQYAELVTARRAYVARQGKVSPDEVDLRTGWLLWQTSLRQFLYFEEPNVAPSPDDYEAVWNTREASGSRKPSTNLWIYEKVTGTKRYSVTTSAGIKIQPYFDVPPLTDPNLYLFTVIGEHIAAGCVRVALTQRTAGALRALLGELTVTSLSTAILDAVDRLKSIDASEEPDEVEESVEFLTISTAAYEALTDALPGVNDEHSFQMLADFLADGGV